MVNLKCPYCKETLHLELVFDSHGKASKHSGNCIQCHKPIKWWGENNKGKIAKN